MLPMATPKHAVRLSAAWDLFTENPVLLAVAGIGFAVSFQTIARVATEQHMPGWPILYPLGIDVGILALIVESRRAIDAGRSDLVPRVMAWALAALTIYVNAHGAPAHDWLGRALHVVMPALVDRVPGADPLAQAGEEARRQAGRYPAGALAGRARPHHWHAQADGRAQHHVLPGGGGAGRGPAAGDRRDDGQPSAGGGSATPRWSCATTCATGRCLPRWRRHARWRRTGSLPSPSQPRSGSLARSGHGTGWLPG